MMLCWSLTLIRVKLIASFRLGNCLMSKVELLPCCKSALASIFSNTDFFTIFCGLLQILIFSSSSAAILTKNNEYLIEGVVDNIHLKYVREIWSRYSDNLNHQTHKII